MSHHHRISQLAAPPITVEFARPGTAGGRLESDNGPRALRNSNSRALLRTISSLRLAAANNPYNPASYSVPGSVTASARTSYTRVDAMDQEQAQEREREAIRRELEGRGSVDGSPNEDLKEPESESSQAEGPPRQESEEPVVPQTPQISITFLLVTGNRRVMSFEPETTVGRVKELVWSSWPSDWQNDERPPAPSYLRILYLGRILQDDDTLSKLNFPHHTPPPAAQGNSSDPPPAVTTPTIVHLSIRPLAAGSLDDDALNKKSLKRRLSISAGQEGGCCGCVLM